MDEREFLERFQYMSKSQLEGLRDSRRTELAKLMQERNNLIGQIIFYENEISERGNNDD